MVEEGLSLSTKEPIGSITSTIRQRITNFSFSEGNLVDQYL
jgi:hypothetical protein